MSSIQDVMLQGELIATVHKSENNSYNIVTEKNPLNTEKIKKMIKNYSYTGQRRIRDSETEKAKLPFMIKTYFELFVTNFEIPTEDLFLETYLKNYKSVGDGFSQIRIPNAAGGFGLAFSTEGIIARALRFYPSIIRDHYLFHLCTESGYFTHVSYSTVNDLNGKDIFVEYNGKKYAIAVFVNSKDGNKYMDLKDKRHEKFEKIRLPIDCIDKKFRVGKFTLPNEYHIWEILKEINNRQQKIAV